MRGQWGKFYISLCRMYARNEKASWQPFNTMLVYALNAEVISQSKHFAMPVEHWPEPGECLMLSADVKHVGYRNTMNL